jgi:hypothetical protein
MSSVVISGDTSGTVTLAAPAVAGSNTLTLQAATATMSVNTLATAVPSTSGTSIDFTSLPTWVKRVTVMFSGVSTSGTSIMQIQLGAGSVTTSGYLGSGGNFNNANSTGVANGTSGIYLLNSGNAANIYYGHATFTTLGSNIWIASGVLGISNTTNVFAFGGGITLGGTLDRVRLTTVGSPATDLFDAGSVNILYEG